MSTAAEHLPMPDAQVEREVADWRDEVSLDELSAGDRILVTTLKHGYEIVVALPEAGEVLVRGGRFFPDYTLVRLAGSLVGASSIKLRSIGVGRRLELGHQGGPVITTPVRDIRIIPAAA